MRYPALIDVDGDRVVADFPDCPGCQAATGSEDDIVAAAGPVLCRWLESCLIDGTMPPKPSAAVVTRDWFEWIEIPTDLADKLLLRWATAKRISRRELARRAGVTEDAIAELQDPTSRPTSAALASVSRALGVAESSTPPTSARATKPRRQPTRTPVKKKTPARRR